MDDTGGNNRLRALVEAGMALTSEPSLDGLLKRLVDAAATLTDARYAALGVIDPSGQRLERFITHGIEPDVEAEIGPAPSGRGILGILLHSKEPLRIHDLGADPRSVGFPPNHPPMRTFLGVPVLLRGVTYGNLYLTEKIDGGDFTRQDEELVTMLAAQAAIAIENVRLLDASRTWSARLEALNEIGNALVTETDLEKLLQLVADRLRELLGARLVTVVLPAGKDMLRFAAVSGETDEPLRGRTFPRSESKSGRVLTTRVGERIDSLLDDPDVNQDIIRAFAGRAGLWMPLVVHDHAIGVISAHDKLETWDARFTDEDLRLAETYAARAAIAVERSGRVGRDALRRIMSAQELERRRLARELHDETGQALTSILLGLRSLEDSIGDGAPRAAVARIRELTVDTIHDVRRLAVELRPKALDDFGLASALERLTQTFSEQTGIAIEFADRLGGEKLSSEAATALYRIVQEALTNVVKHAQAEHVSVLLTRKNASIVIVIEDDGRGFDPTGTGDGSGIESMRERIELFDGSLVVESREGSGTTLVAEVPIS